MIPRFAVVGRVNEGKTSVIAALTENDTLRIGPEAGTTRRCERLPVAFDGKTAFEVIDTPGFQEPEAALDWLRRNGDDSALSRPEMVRKFVERFQGSGRFTDECELLRPILDGASILYVADPSHPFRPGFEAELEILRWTGRPRMAVINRIGSRDYTDDWRTALGQYFNIIKDYNAHTAGSADRLALLRALKSLEDYDPSIGEAVDHAIEALEHLEVRRREEAARIIADLVADACSLTLSQPLGTGEERSAGRAAWIDDYARELRSREQNARREIESLYNFQKLTSEDPGLERQLIEDDLFSGDVWVFLGLEKRQLVMTGTLTGAAGGGAFDLAVGGHSFFLGAALGGLAGLTSTAYLSYVSPTKRWIGVRVCGHDLQVGPVKNPNFPWIVLDRALLHHDQLTQRTHAVRTPLKLDQPSSQAGVVAELSASRRRRIQRLFTQLRGGKGSDARANLAREVQSLLS